MPVITKVPREMPALSGGPTPEVELALPAFEPQSPALSGTVRFVHSDRTIGIVPRWVEALGHYHPDLKIETLIVASSVAAKTFVDNDADVAFIGREMLWNERDLFAAHFGGLPRRFAGCGGNLDIPGTTHAVAVFVHKDNPLTQISLDQLDALYSTTRDQGLDPIRTWGDLGLEGEWAEQPIKLWGQTPDVGFDRFVQERSLLGGDYREDIELLHQVDTIPQRVAEDRYAIGYAGFGHGLSAPGAKALALSPKVGEPAVACTPETVLSQEYPFSRRLYLFVPGAGNEPIPPAVAEILRYALSREGQACVAEDGLFLPLPERVVHADRARLESLARKQ